MATGSEVASVYVRIGADMSGLSNGLAQASGAVDSMSSAFGALKGTAIGFIAASAVREVGDFFKQLASDAYAAVAAQEKLGLSAQSLAASELMAADSSLSLDQAMFMSAHRAQELLEFVQQLSLTSPYSQEMIGQGVRQAMLYGLQSEQAMSLTQALVDYASAAGLTNDEMGRLGMAFGQMAGKGKLMGEEMRQFTNAGFGVATIAQIMGMEVGEVATAMKAGEISAADLIAGFIEFSQLRFGGKAEEMAGSLYGMAETLQDVKALGLRKVFGEFNAETGETSGLIGALQPVMQEFMATLTDPKFLAALTTLGETFSASFASNISDLATTLPSVVESLMAMAPVLMKLGGPIISGAIGNLTGMAGTAAGIGELAGNLGTLVSMVVDPAGQLSEKFGGFVEFLKTVALVGNPAMLFFKLMADQLERVNKAFGPVLELIAKWRGVGGEEELPDVHTIARRRTEQTVADGERPRAEYPVEPTVTEDTKETWFNKVLQGLGLRDAPMPIPADLSLDLASIEASGMAMGMAARRGYDRGFGMLGTLGTAVDQALQSRGAW